VTYTAIGDGLDPRPFDAAQFEVLPPDWLARGAWPPSHPGPHPSELEDREEETKARPAMVRGRVARDELDIGT
jgi:hypothetical protein